jgi:hypothetical protein
MALVIKVKALRIDVFPDLVIGTDGVGDLVCHEVIHMTGRYLDAWHMNLIEEMASKTQSPAVFSLPGHGLTLKRGVDHAVSKWRCSRLDAIGYYLELSIRLQT